MARFFNDKKVELLAPAGNMEIFRSIVKANCDAVYLGGKSLNMRMIRKGFNLSDEELIEAVKLAHDNDKKLYVTVNNIMNEYEIDEAREYLHFLNSLMVDGLIIQDMSVLKLCKEEKLDNFELHSSIMMNVHNIETVEALKELGVSRVVLSREMDLKTAKNLQNQTGIETEYFVHGDMCTVNGANCYYSSVLWGNSSNRGRCFKPCRWAYKVKKDGMLYPTEYPMAAKDMYMYEHIPELIDACVTSFKIEGRMRETDFIVDLVNTYGDAIDRYIADPLAYNRKEKSEHLFKHRKRDFSTAYAFGKPGLDFINTRYEGTGKFYSTGKVFSVPSEEPELSDSVIENVKAELNVNMDKKVGSRKLSVKVNNFEQARLILEMGVDRVYLPCEVLLPDTFMTSEQLQQLAAIKGSAELYLNLPQMTDELWLERIDQYLEKHGSLFDGLMVSNLGAVRKYAGKYPIIADYNMNLYNHKAAELYGELGVNQFTPSIECKSNELAALLSTVQKPMELIVHGPLKVMYLDLNLYDNTKALDPIEKTDNKYVDNSILVLMSDKGENPVYIDQTEKNHLYTNKELCFLPLLGSLSFDNLMSLRIEGQTYKTNELKYVIQVYKQAMSDTSKCMDLFKTMKSSRAGFTLGALSYKYSKE